MTFPPTSPLLLIDPDPPPHYEDLFPPDYTPFPKPDTALQQMTNNRLPIPSIPLEPPPPYGSLFTTAAPLDSVAAPPDIWENPYCWDTDAKFRLGLVVPAWLNPPQYLNIITNIFNTTCSNSNLKTKSVLWRCGPSSQAGVLHLAMWLHVLVYIL